MNVATARPADVPLRHVAAALGLDRSAFYPRPPTASPTTALAAGQPRALSAVERQQTLDLLHSERFCDQAPRQVHATCLSEGLLVASWSTMYRLLRAGGESQERRGIRPPQRHAVPQLIATAPNQVWTWDITKLLTLVRGVFLCLYVILDLYSRQVVGWMVSRRENAGLAKHLFGRVLSARAIAPDQLIVHQDRGAPMTALCFTDLLESLGVERSYSRPRVSNDNAFSESQFKTLKYAPDYPERFEGPEHARQWLTGFFDHYHQRTPRRPRPVRPQRPLRRPRRCHPCHPSGHLGHALPKAPRASSTDHQRPSARPLPSRSIPATDSTPTPPPTCCNGQERSPPTRHPHRKPNHLS